MAGVVMNCLSCGKKLWDEETSYDRCIYCNQKIRGLTDKEKIKILEKRIEILEKKEKKEAEKKR
jgi:DNA-directed RNA polymerase subunit RPC12/RpoP